jgi:hypothetical protein
VRLIRWHLEDDSFEPGQWLKSRIYERRCELALRGDLLIYFAANHRPPFRSWTAWRFAFDRLWQKPQPGPGGCALRMLVCGIGERNRPWYRLDHDVIDAQGRIRVYLPETDWADWDRNGDLLFSRAGALFRLPAAIVGRGDEFGEQARCLAEFGNMVFERIAAPIDMTHC